jgi:curved DNA-binding protein CbpA
MKSVYDLLGVPPDASAEAVKTAFRAAVKLHHPDHHPGEPDAPSRFRRITAAYAILRNDKRRAAYDRRLALERQRIRSMRMRIIISDAIYGAVTMMLVIGFLWMETILPKSIWTDKVEWNMARERTEMAVVQSAARNDATERDGLWDGLEMIPERAIEPSAARPAAETTAVQTIARHGPAVRPLPNALGDIPADRLDHVSAQR